MGMPDLHRSPAEEATNDTVRLLTMILEEHRACGVWLKRLVEIEEERIAIDKANAKILSGVMDGVKGEGPRYFEDYRESADGMGYEVMVAGRWLVANQAEVIEIRAKIQDRRRRR